MTIKEKNPAFILVCLVFAILFFKCTKNKTDTDWATTLEEELKVPEFKKDTFNIMDYGAIQDSIALNTASFQKAIADCSKKGGGTVLVPNGNWRVGPIHLQSNVNLHVSEKATLSFSEKFEDYLPTVLVQRGGYYCYTYSPFIYANEKENIGITGKGTIDANGQVWWPWKKNQPGMKRLFKMGKAGTPIEERQFGTIEDGVRPPFVQFIKCSNVYMEGVTIKDGPSWMIHPVESSNLIFKELTLQSHGPNNDGIDPDMCKNVIIEDCILDVGDDNIAIKSGMDEEAWKIGVPSENIIVRGCESRQGHGGFVIGSGMSAGVKNVLVENCSFIGTKRGIRLKTRLGRGGYVENVTIRNISMENIREEAIIINMQYDGEPIERNMNYSENAKSDEGVPIIHNILMENILCKNANSAIKIKGLGKDALRQIQITNASIKAKNGVLIDNVHSLQLRELDLSSDIMPLIEITNAESIDITSKYPLPSASSDKWLSIENSKAIKINNKKY